MLGISASLLDTAFDRICEVTQGIAVTVETLTYTACRISTSFRLNDKTYQKNSPVNVTVKADRHAIHFASFFLK